MATTKFINECKKPANSNRLGQVTIGSTTINQHDYLSSMTLNESCYVDGSVIGTNYSKSVDVNALDTYTGTLSSGETINPKIGVLYDDNKTEYIDFGNYISEVSNENQTSNATSFIGYDKMINGDAKYICSIETFPSTVGAFYLDVLSQLNLQPYSNTFIGSDITVTANPFTNNESIRDVLSAVEKVSCTFGYINKQGKHELRWFSSTVDYEFSKSDYSTLEGGNIVYGPVNRLLIGNPNIEGDYVLREDESSIEEHGANELYIYEPYFLFNDTLRNEVIDEIWNKVNGFTYTKYELTSYYGKPFLEIGNKIKINRNDDTSFESYVLSHNLEYAGSFTSTISADVMTKEEEEHKNNSKNTSPYAKVEIEINKQNQEITALSEKVDKSSGQFQISNESEGKVVTTEKAGNYLPVDFIFYGDSYQETNPTPTSPKEIDVVDGYRNLFSSTIEQNALNANNGTTYDDIARIRTKDFIVVKGGEKYVLSYDENLSFYTFYYDKNETFISNGGQWFNNGNNFTVPNNANYVKMSFKNSSGTNITPNDISNVILNYTLKNYVPYGQNYLPVIIKSENTENNKIINIPLGNNYFSKIGSVKDTGFVDFTSSQLVKEENIGKIILTGDEEWELQSNGQRYRTRINNSNTVATRTIIISNRFVYGTGNDVGTAFIHTGYLYIYPPTDINTLDKLKEWLMNNETIIYFPLETSTTKFVNIDNSIFEQLRLNQGHNEINIDDTLEPKIYLKYLTDSELNVQYAKTAELQLTNNQIRSEVSETTKIYDSQFDTINKSLDSKLDSDNLTPILANYASTDSVTEVEKKVTNLQTSTNEYIGIVQDVKQNGVSQVRTETGFTFDKNGLTVTKSGAPTKTLVDEDGMKVYSTTGSSQQEMQRTDSTGTYSENITVRKYFVLGSHTRFEDFSGGTGAFFLG